MRPIPIALLLAVLSTVQLDAQAPTPGSLAFSGSGASETTVFAVKDRWQVHYSGPPASVTIEDSTGAALAGMGGGPNCTLYLAAAGNYKVRVMMNPAFASAPAAAMIWRLEISQVGPAGSQVATTMHDYVPPDMTGIASNGGPSASVATTITGAPATSGAASPVSITTPGPVAVPVPSPMLTLSGGGKMTETQVAAMVLIRGDNGEGTGFLVKTAAGPFVVTNQHVIGANPHLTITTTGGMVVKTLGLQAATDRDLAMIAVQDGNYSYLDMATTADMASVAVGDVLITPGNSQGGGVMLPCNGTVVALGPEKIEISNPIYHGNSGGPILHVKTGKVIGVVTEGMKVDTDNAIDKASFNSGSSGINSQIRYFGLRLDNVPTWQDTPWLRFANETEFLREFHERSKCLDSYLNTALNDASEWGTYFARDEKIKDANAAYSVGVSGGGDNTQRMDAVRDLIFSLDAVADAQLDQIGNPSAFLPYDQQRAKDEMAYRKSLKTEIGNMSSDVNRIAGLARPTN